jgi:deoxyribose-phosphate aldolase
MTNTEIAKMIDHSLLKPDATASQIERLCDEARKHGFGAVCVNPSFVPLCHERLAGSDVKIATVIGFPLGATTSASKAFEAAEAVRNGASEIDMVLAVGRLKGGETEAAEEDIASVVRAVPGVPVKVILETGLLTDEEKVLACRLAREAGAAFVKTSTGFGPGGATEADIKLMRETVGEGMGVKASGGIRDAASALVMIKAGANRLGTSAGVAIVNGVAGQAGVY